VRSGSRLRTAIGELAVGEVTPVDPKKVTVRDARRAGFASREALFASLRADPDRTLYRIGISLAGPDRRIVLREQAELTEVDLEEVCAVLRGIDARSKRGPWTVHVLRLIAEQPGVRAADLATLLGRERLPFKADVRRLKELGLTESLEIGYRLSPRGRRVLDHLGGSNPSEQGKSSHRSG
jgi:hypothetical protein